MTTPATELSRPEKNAILGILKQMAQSDGQIVSREVDLLQVVHEGFFGRRIPKALREPWPPLSKAVEVLQRPEAQQVALRLLYDMLRADDVEHPDEVALFGEVGKAFGLSEEEIESEWSAAAEDLFARTANTIVFATLEDLGAQLRELRKTLNVGAESSALAEESLRRQAAEFRVEPSNDR